MMLKKKRILAYYAVRYSGRWVWLFLLATESGVSFYRSIEWDNAWETYYSKILIANNVIDLLDDAEELRAIKMIY